MSDKLTVGTFINALVDEGHATSEALDAAAEVIAGETVPSAWYIQGVMGCGGWIAALMFFFSCGSLFAFAFFDNDNALGAVLFGLVLVAATTFARQRIGNLAASQFILANHLMGQFWFGFGLIAINDDFTAMVGLMVAALNAAVLVFYPDMLMRFLAALAVYTGLLLVPIDFTSALPMVYWAIMSGVAGAVVLTIFGGLLLPHVEIRWHELLIPSGYASALVLVTLLIVPLIDGDLRGNGLAALVLSSLLMFALTLWAAMRVMQDMDMTWRGRGFAVMGVILAIVALLTSSTPGVMGALLLLVLGQRSRDGVLSGLGYAALVGFVVYYYYDLSVTLWAKSLVLMATGALLLGGRFALRAYFPVPDKNKEALG